MLTRLLGPLLALLALAPFAASQAMVQLSLEDRGVKLAQDQPLPNVHVEVELGGLIKGQERQVQLNWLLAPGTRASDLAELLAKRFERAGFDVLAPQPLRGEKQDRGTLFVQDALFLRLRLSGGLAGQITTCEGPPASVKVMAPTANPKAGTLAITGLAQHPLKDLVEPLSMELELGAKDHPAQVSQRLHELGSEHGLLGERPGGDAWRPIRTVQGSQVRGLTLQVRSEGDWRLEVALPKRPASSR